MKTHFESEGSTVRFVITEADLAYHEAIEKLAYQPTNGGFSKTFPATPGIQRIYANFAHHAEAMVLQAAGKRTVPWDSGMEAALRLVKGSGARWSICGSAALAMRGLPVVPRDIDFIVYGSAENWNARLADYLIEPVVDSTGWICEAFGRAFLSCRIEWIINPNEAADTPDVSDFGMVAAGRLVTISWRGFRVKVPPLDLQLETSRRRGLTERAALIQAAIDAGAR